jgi:hypothetical protein
MCPRTHLLGIIVALGLLSGCHTLTAVVSGPTLGGVSLTARLWNSESNLGTKILVATFAFGAGTVAGPIAALPRGANLDLEHHDLWFEAAGYLRVLDPFEGGLFNNPSQEAAVDVPPRDNQSSKWPPNESVHLTCPAERAYDQCDAAGRAGHASDL